MQMKGYIYECDNIICINDIDDMQYRRCEMIVRGKLINKSTNFGKCMRVAIYIIATSQGYYV